MPNLSIKNVPENVVARLRARARANHRSLQGELLDPACRAAETHDAGAISGKRLRGRHWSISKHCALLVAAST